MTTEIDDDNLASDDQKSLMSRTVVSEVTENESIQTASNRPPFFYVPDENPAIPPDVGLIYRYRYYGRLDPRSESSLTMPRHILPPNFFTIASFRHISKQGSLITIFSIWNTMMGTALLAMPWALNQAGIILGPALIIFMGLVAYYTAYRVVDNTAETAKIALHREIEFADVCRYYFGAWGGRVALIFSLISLLGATVVYWVLMSNFLYNTGLFYHQMVYDADFSWSNIQTNLSMSCDIICAEFPASNSSIDPIIDKMSTFHRVWQLRRTVPLFLFLLIFPFLNFESPTFFTKFNGLGTISVFYLLGFVSAKLYKCGVNIDFSGSINLNLNVHFFKWTFPALTGTLALSYFLHNCVVTILKNQRRPENNNRDLGIAYTLVITTYTFISMVFFVAFPLNKDCIADNMLNNFGTGDLLSIIARVFLLFQMLTVYPLLTYLIRIQIFSQINLEGIGHIAALNFMICGFGILFAMFFPSVGSILRFVGSISGLVYVFALPCMVHMERLKKEGRLTRSVQTLHFAIIGLGVANFLAQFALLL